MIRLQRSMLEGLTGPAITPQTVCASLQQAIELEHATIPPYLYALYSLDTAKNAAIAQIIQSVVLEEMLHMTLSSNVMNALGGSPDIDKPGFVPTYPGPLPGGVEADLTVNLAPFSMTQLQTFLQIESPADPLVYKSTAMAEMVSKTITIGEFYTAISDAIGQLGDSAFIDPPRNQIGPEIMPGAIVVTDVASAQQAISVIIEQGEGTSTSPEDGDGEVAHYYRFMQIQKGHLLVPVPGSNPPTYAYTGAPVPFDPTGVYAVPTNPGVPPGYPIGSAQAFANDNFNYTYASLLISLHAMFNGDNSQQQFNQAIGVMMSLKGQAKAMMAGIPNPAVLTGPSFQFQPVNPPS
ncbi:MAG: ferritin-like protein [Xanthomonadales bacterium]|nr:ferritin-like protein [Xanthomonadales bacterium]